LLRDQLLYQTNQKGATQIPFMYDKNLSPVTMQRLLHHQPAAFMIRIYFG